MPEDLPPLDSTTNATDPARPSAMGDGANAPTNPAHARTAAGSIDTDASAHTDGGPTPVVGDPGAPQESAHSVLDARDVPSSIGRYRVIGRIATGGMADILLGKLTGPSGFERAVVIKSILPHLARDEEFVGMFLDEARLTAQIRHPNVVQVHELGRDGPVLYLVMEYLDGESCNTILREAARRGVHPPHVLAAHICAEVAAGLHAAHTLTDEDGKSRAVVHRDVSPQNVLVTYDGQVKLLDFGIAKATGRMAEGTKAGQIKGKFAYMAPEQATRAEVDARTDIFSLGVVLWEMTTGRRLFKRPSELMVLRALSEEPIPKPSDQIKRYPPLLEAIVMRALARDPKERFQTALDLRQALSGWLRGTDSDDTVEHQLASYMTDRFAERAAVKRGLMTRAVAIDSFEELEISVVNEPSLEMTSSEAMFDMPVPPAAAPVQRLPWLVVVTVVSVVACGAAIAMLLLRTQPPRAVVTTSAIPPLAPVPSSTVTMHLQSIPSESTVAIDGVERGRTPLDVAVPRDRALTLEISHPGYLSVRVDRVPKNDLELELSLEREASTRPTPTSPPGKKPPRRKADPFHRFE